MIEWIKGWSQQTWILAWVMAAASLALLVYLFGAATVQLWIAAAWSAL